MESKRKIVVGAAAILIGLLTQACAQPDSSTSSIHYLNGSLSTTSTTTSSSSTSNADYTKYFGGNINQAAIDSPSNPLNSGTVTAWSSGSTGSTGSIGSTLTVDIFTTDGQWGEVSLQMAQTTTTDTENGYTAWGVCADSDCNTFVLLLQADSLGMNPAPQVVITLVKSPSDGTDSSGYSDYVPQGSSSSDIGSDPIWI